MSEMGRLPTLASVREAGERALGPMSLRGAKLCFVEHAPESIVRSTLRGDLGWKFRLLADRPARRTCAQLAIPQALLSARSGPVHLAHHSQDREVARRVAGPIRPHKESRQVSGASTACASRRLAHRPRRPPPLWPARAPRAAAYRRKSVLPGRRLLRRLVLGQARAGRVAG